MIDVMIVDQRPEITVSRATRAVLNTALQKYRPGRLILFWWGHHPA
jgi:hypothetical protein